MTDIIDGPPPAGPPVTASLPVLNGPRTPLGRTLAVFPLALDVGALGAAGGRDDAFAVLDGYLAAGGNFLDAGHAGAGRGDGGSERLVGEWIAARGLRDALVLAAGHGAAPGPRPEGVRAAVLAALQRLGVERLDLYYARPDADAPLEETAEAVSRLVDEGLVGAVGLAGGDADGLRDWLEAAERGGLHRPVALRTRYGLMDREAERELLPLARRAEAGVVALAALAPEPGERGERVLHALNGISGRLKVHPCSVALAWLLARPGVVAPLASAASAQTLPLLLDAVRVRLDPSEVEELERTSA